MEQQVNHNYSKAIQLIKSAILKSRYRAAALANRELLSLYYGIGKYISENSRYHFWGTNAIETISKQLQQELPGLRGFSEGNLRKMRIFFEEWGMLNSNRSLPANEIQKTDITTSDSIRPLSADEIQTDLLTVNRQLTTDETNIQGVHIELSKLNRQPTAGDLNPEQLDLFFRLGFAHHCEIIAKAKLPEERLFYIENCATGFWSKETLRHHLKSDLYAKQGKLPKSIFASGELEENSVCRNFRQTADDGKSYQVKFYNPPNGWSSFEGFVTCCKSALRKCHEYPDAVIEAAG